MAKQKLTDFEVHDRLVAAAEALGREEAETVRGRTALEAARRALTLLQVGLVYAVEAGEDKIPGVIEE